MHMCTDVVTAENMELGHALNPVFNASVPVGSISFSRVVKLSLSSSCPGTIDRFPIQEKKEKITSFGQKKKKKSHAVRT